MPARTDTRWPDGPPPWRDMSEQTWWKLYRAERGKLAKPNEMPTDAQIVRSAREATRKQLS